MKNLNKVILDIVFTVALVMAFTQERWASAAGPLVIFLWLMGALVIISFVADKDGCAHAMAAHPLRPTWQKVLSVLMATIQIGAIAYSGRPWLAAVVFIAVYVVLDAEQKADELREEQAQQGLPPAQVKCPCHR